MSVAGHEFLEDEDCLRWGLPEGLRLKFAAPSQARLKQRDERRVGLRFLCGGWRKWERPSGTRGSGHGKPSAPGGMEQVARRGGGSSSFLGQHPGLGLQRALGHRELRETRVREDSSPPASLPAPGQDGLRNRMKGVKPTPEKCKKVGGGGPPRFNPVPTREGPEPALWATGGEAPASRHPKLLQAPRPTTALWLVLHVRHERGGALAFPSKDCQGAGTPGQMAKDILVCTGA
ncbi:uncharacterized protein LOC119936619 [Tachyglossus aculeatus]|uniref:uncharacterized protein LOC119936619 n=1 Tax=Tachyglossus aculeatus TaxID=9261 RepID=UPI0018F416ED|nr:uncharacterized protein LOC119936619 [Tachyglossus aculeatus]